MDSVDRIQNTFYMLIYGMAIHDSGWMLGLLPLMEPALPVERIGVSYQQSYPQEKAFSSHPYLGVFTKGTPIYGGPDLWIFSARFGLVHSRRYLSTKYRDLSTVSPSWTGLWGITLPPNVAARLNYTKRKSNQKQRFNPQIAARAYPEPGRDSLRKRPKRRLP